MRSRTNLIAACSLALASSGFGTRHRGRSGDLPDTSRTLGDTLDVTKANVRTAVAALVQAIRPTRNSLVSSYTVQESSACSRILMCKTGR